MTGFRRSLRQLLTVEVRYWALAAVGWAALAATALPAATPVRVTAVYLFTLIVPGFALSAFVTTNLVERCVLAVALSASLAIVVSVLMTALRNDSMLQRVALLAGVTTIASLTYGLRRMHTEEATSDDAQQRAAR